MRRRSFLQGLLVLSGSALIEVPRPAAAGGPGENAFLDTSEWVYDVPTGVFKNPNLTKRILRRASIQGGRRWRMSDKLAPTSWLDRDKSQEYGQAYRVLNLKDDWYLDSMIGTLARVNRRALRWHLVPEVRAALPVNFGRICYVDWYGIAEA